jgi:sec-independent protein translocase protein TatA
MDELSIYHWLLVLLVVLLLFGGRKIPELMRGIGEEIRAFRQGTTQGPDGSSTSHRRVQ